MKKVYAEWVYQLGKVFQSLSFYNIKQKMQLLLFKNVFKKLVLLDKFYWTSLMNCLSLSQFFPVCTK